MIKSIEEFYAKLLSLVFLLDCNIFNMALSSKLTETMRVRLVTMPLYQQRKGNLQLLLYKQRSCTNNLLGALIYNNNNIVSSSEFVHEIKSTEPVTLADSAHPSKICQNIKMAILEIAPFQRSEQETFREIFL
jgi:hypothetical protein